MFTSGASSASTVWGRRQGSTERRSVRTSTRGSVVLICVTTLPGASGVPCDGQDQRFFFLPRCWRPRGLAAPLDELDGVDGVVVPYGVAAALGAGATGAGAAGDAAEGEGTGAPEGASASRSSSKSSP